MLSEQEILSLGFKLYDKSFTVTKSYNLSLKKNLVMILSDPATANEMLTLGSLNEDKRFYDDLVVINNYDYDGLLDIETLVQYINPFL